MKGDKVKICKNCRFYVESKLGRTVRSHSGYCTVNVRPEFFLYVYNAKARARAVNRMEVMSNGFCREYEERASL